MKHNKSRNVGVLFESLIHNAMLRVAENDVDGASKLISVIKNYFMENTEVSKAYKVYSQLLYAESRNTFYASRFYSNLIKEYNSLDNTKINAEISKLHVDISKNFSLKEVLNVKIPNYKLFASFKIMTEQTDQYISSKDQMHCDNIILEHLVDNKELERVASGSGNIDIKDMGQIDAEQLAFAIAIKEFHKDYGSSLISEQKECIVKYYSSPTSTFNNWVFNKLDGMLDEVAHACLKVEDETVKEKLVLVNERLKKIKENKQINSDSFVEIMMGFELCDKLKDI
jgi:hypothetical protein